MSDFEITVEAIPEIVEKNLRHTPRDARDRIVTCVNGPNGLGKSEATEQGVESYAEAQALEPVYTNDGTVAQKGEYGITVMNFSNYQPEDLQFPNVTEDVYRQVVSDVLPFANSRWGAQSDFSRDDYRGVLICDEVGKNKQLFSAMSQWVCEGSGGNGEKIPSGLQIIFLTNDATHNSSAVNLTSDLMNRVCHVTVRKCVKAFLNFHRGDRALHPVTTACAKYIGEDYVFTQWDGKRGERPGKPFASPRSHRRNSRIMDEINFDPKNISDRARIHGNLGTSATVATVACFNVHDQLNDLDAMLESPSVYKEQIQALCVGGANGDTLTAGLIAMLVKRVKTDHSEFAKAMEFFEVMGVDENLATFATMAVDVAPEVADTSAYVRHFCESAPDYLF